MKKLYLFSAAGGLVLPYTFFVSFLPANGLDRSLLFEQLFASDMSTFFALDVIIRAMVLVLILGLVLGLA